VNPAEKNLDNRAFVFGRLLFLRPETKAPESAKDQVSRELLKKFWSAAQNGDEYAAKVVKRVFDLQHQRLDIKYRGQRWSDVFDRFFAAFDAAWNVPDFYTAHPDDLNAAFACIDDAQEKASALATHLSTIWREHPDLKQRHKLRLDDCLKVIAHMAEDSRVFQQNELGYPCPVAVSFIEEAL